MKDVLTATPVPYDSQVLILSVGGSLIFCILFRPLTRSIFYSGLDMLVRRRMMIRIEELRG